MKLIKSAFDYILHILNNPSQPQSLDNIRFLMKALKHPNRLALMCAVKPYTSLSYERLSQLYETALKLENENIVGSFVECGVQNGGSAGIFSFIANKLGNTRRIYLFDSFEGLPDPSEYDVDYSGYLGKKGMDLGSEQKVRELLFKKLHLNENNIQIVKGWFEDSIPRHKKDVGKIALLHLDCDWYNSVKFCLEHLYDNVVSGGFIQIDDYGHWKGCKKAVDEFLDHINLKKELTEIDYTAVYFRKMKK